jgi:hypothetical protein
MYESSELVKQMSKCDELVSLCNSGISLFGLAYQSGELDELD